MKAIKRTVAALLATLMLATSTSFTLAAENLDKDEEIVIAKVEAAGIMQGTGNGFEPSMTLTRAQAAAIVVRMKGISEDTIAKTSGETNFKDVAANEWYAPYVAQALITGIVKGVSATEFAPTKEVTIQEFVTMAVRALGAGQLVDSDVTAWPTNYINFANENKLLDKVNGIPATVANRLQAATIVANTLEAVMWEKSGVKSNGEISWTKDEDGKTILSEVLNIDKYEVCGIADADINTKDRKLAATCTYKNGEKKTSGYYSLSGDVADDVDLASLKSGLVYDIWYNTKDKEIVGIWESEDSELETIKFTEIVKVTLTNALGGAATANDKVKLMVDGKEKEYKFVQNDANTSSVDETAMVYYNGNSSFAKQYNDTGTKLAQSKNIFGTAILDGSKISALYLEEYTNYGVVKEIKNDKVKFETTDVEGENCSTLDIDEDGANEFAVSKNGKDIKMADLEEGDAIFYYDNGSNKYTVVVANNTVEGKVTAIASSYVKLDGTRYNLSGISSAAFDNGSEIKAYLNEAGYIVMFETIEESDNSDYAVISKLEAIVNTKGKGTAEVTFTTLDGSKTDVYELDLDEMVEKFKSHDSGYEKVTLVAGDLDDTDYVDDDNRSNASTKTGVVYKVKGVAKDTTTPAYVYTTEAKAEEAIKKELINKLFGATTIATSLNDAAANTKALGQLVRYEIKSGKAVITEFAGTDTSADDQLKAIAAANITVGSKVTSWGTALGIDGYFTDSTKVLVVKDDKKSSVKVSVLDIEDLDTTTGIAGYVGKFDKDTKEFGIAVLTETSTVKVNKVTENETFAMIVAKAASYNDDYDYEYDVVFAGSNKVESFFSDKELNLYHVYELNISGEEITGIEKAEANTAITALADATVKGLYLLDTTNDYVVKEVFSNDTVEFGTVSGTTYAPSTDRLVLADEVIYLENDAVENTYALGKTLVEADIDVTTNAIENTNYSKIDYMVLYRDEDGNIEVVAMVTLK